MQRERQCLILSLPASSRPAATKKKKESRREVGLCTKDPARQAVMETRLLTSAGRCIWCFPARAHPLCHTRNLWTTLVWRFSFPMAVIPASSTIGISWVSPCCLLSRRWASMAFRCEGISGRPSSGCLEGRRIFPHICNVTLGLCCAGPSKGGRLACSLSQTHTHTHSHIHGLAHISTYSGSYTLPLHILSRLTYSPSVHTPTHAHTHPHTPTAFPEVAASSDAWHVL